MSLGLMVGDFTVGLHIIKLAFGNPQHAHNILVGQNNLRGWSLAILDFLPHQTDDFFQFWISVSNRMLLHMSVKLYREFCTNGICVGENIGVRNPTKYLFLFRWYWRSIWHKLSQRIYKVFVLFSFQYFRNILIISLTT